MEYPWPWAELHNTQSTESEGRFTLFVCGARIFHSSSQHAKSVVGYLRACACCAAAGAPACCHGTGAREGWGTSAQARPSSWAALTAGRPPGRGPGGPWHAGARAARWPAPALMPPLLCEVPPALSLVAEQALGLAVMPGLTDMKAMVNLPLAKVCKQRLSPPLSQSPAQEGRRQFTPDAD